MPRCFQCHLLWICWTLERVNPFPHTTILQQRTLNIFYQKIENLFNWMDNLWLKLENIVAKGEIAHFEQFLLLSLCFKKPSAAGASIWGKGLNSTWNLCFHIFNCYNLFKADKYENIIWVRVEIHDLDLKCPQKITEVPPEMVSFYCIDSNVCLYTGTNELQTVGSSCQIFVTSSFIWLVFLTLWCENVQVDNCEKWSARSIYINYGFFSDLQRV